VGGLSTVKVISPRTDQGEDQTLIGETWFSNNTNDLNHSTPESQLLDCKWRAPHQARSLFESLQSLFGHGHRMGARINRGY